MFDGVLDANFTYHIRRDDPERRLHVLRGDKLFYTVLSDTRGGYRQFAESQADVLATIERYDPRFVIVETSEAARRLPAARLLRETLAAYPGRFRHEATFMVDSNRRRIEGTTLLIYRKLDPQSAARAGIGDPSIRTQPADRPDRARPPWDRAREYRATCSGPPRDGTAVKLNLGCGPVQPAGWINVDGSNRAFWRVRFRGWIRFSLGWGYSSLRSLIRAECSTSIWQGVSLGPMAASPQSISAKCWNISRSRKLSTSWRSAFARYAAAAFFASEFLTTQRSGKNYLKAYVATKELPSTEWNDAHAVWIRMFFADVCVDRPKPWMSMGHFHKWMFDDVSLVVALRAAGFKDPARRRYLESAIEDISAVENRDDLIVEAAK